MAWRISCTPLIRGQAGEMSMVCMHALSDCLQQYNTHQAAGCNHRAKRSILLVSYESPMHLVWSVFCESGGIFQGKASIIIITRARYAA